MREADEKWVSVDSVSDDGEWVSIDSELPKIDQADVRSIVSSKETVEGFGSEDVERNKTIMYLKESGYGVTPDTVELYKNKLFGRDSSWGAVNRGLANQLSVEPIGPVRRSAKTRKHNVNQLIYQEQYKSPFPTEYNGESLSAKDRQLMLEQLMLGPELLAGRPMKGFASGILSVKEAPAFAMRTIGGGFLMLGDLTKSNQFTLEGRRMVRMAAGLSKAPDDLLRPMLEALSNGDAKTIDEFLDVIFPTSQTVSQSKKLSFFGGLTEMAGQIYGYSRLGAMAPVGIYSDVNKSVYSTLTEYMDDDRAAIVAIPITITAGVLQAKAIQTTFAEGAVANTGAKAMLVKSLRRAADRGVPALYEGVGETFEEGAPIFAGGGFEALKENAGKLVNVFATSFLATFALKTGVDIKASGAKAEIAAGLESEGYSKETSKAVAEILVSEKTEAEKDAEIQKHLELQKSRQDLVRAIEGYAQTFDQASREVDTEESIEGLGGRPLTDIDIEVLRNQPELMEDLDDSPEADLLKKAVEEGDQGALAEYNQSVVGVEEDVTVEEQAPAVEESPVAPVEQAQETPVEQAEKPVDQTLADLEREMRSDKREQKDYTMPEEGETDELGVPRLIGMSRNFNQQWNDELDLGNVSQAQRVEWATTLNNAYKMNLHTRTQDLIDKVKNGDQLNSDEIAGLLIAKADMANKIEANALEIRKADAAGDTERAAELRAMQGEMINRTIEIAETARQAGTENARALAAMAMVMDRKSFTLENVLSLATIQKGKPLTEAETENLTKMQEELSRVEEELTAKQKRDQKKLDRENAEAQLLIENLQNVSRKVREKKAKGEDPNADLKFLIKRQDEVIRLINKLAGREATKTEEKTAREPDSEGYLEMIENLEAELELKKAREKAFDRNVKLIDKRDAVLAEIENMHRDIKEKADNLEKSKLQKDTALYEQARRDQDTIASLLAELRGDVQEKATVTKEDVYGYKQTISELHKQISDKKLVEKIQREIEALDKAIAEGDVDFKALPKEQQDRVNKELEEAKKAKAERRKQLDAMRRDRDRLDREQAEAIEILEEIQTASRIIKEKKAKKEDVNADLKLIRSRQDKLFDIIDEINRGKPQAEKIKKVRKPDSEGYLDMIEALKPELRQKRKIRRLDADIKRMEDALESGDLSGFIKPKKQFKEESKEVREKMARRLALQQEINRRIQNMAPNSAMKVVAHGYDMFRTSKLTFDFGHILRQGGANMTDWRLWADGSNLKMLGQTFTAMSGKGAINAQLDVMSSPYYEIGQQAGLRIPKEGEQLTEKEQLKMGGWFGRSQVAGTAAIRQALFDSIVSQYEGDITLEEAKDVAFAVNILTGYGQGVLKGGGVEKVLNTVFISPRFRLSRYQSPALLLLSRDGRKVWDNKILRKRIIENQAQFAISRLVMMGLAAAMWPDEVKIITDKDHWAFGRIAVETESGQWRVYNPWAGITAALAWMRKTKESGDVIGAFLDTAKTSKHPFFQFAAGMATGELYGGDKAPRAEIALRSFMPITVEGFVDSWVNDTGRIDLVASTIADAIGWDNTLVSYEDLQSKDATKDEFEPKRIDEQMGFGTEYEGWFGR